LQGPVASLIGQRLGSLESVFIIHLSGAVVSAIPLLAAGGGALGRWQELPWYAFLAGVPGIVIVSATNLTIPRLGATTTIALVVAGQLIIGLLIDHFGLLGVLARPLDLSRLAGVLVLFAGVYLLMR
ncbi:MAG: DMT family transporter, partial [Anaerolineae bacterium]|nr:DMT family transporter [Anaerolineae bacterium]